MKTYKNVQRGVAFLIGLAVLIIVVSGLFQRRDKLKVYDALAVGVRVDMLEAEPANSMDVLFFGDSESYSAFSPQFLKKEYDYNSFVCGTPGQKICDSYVILKESFKTQKPKVVVLETNCLFRGLAQKKNDDVVLNTLTEHVPLFANHTRWKMVVRKMIPKSHTLRNSKQKGFVVRKSVQPYKGGAYMKKTTKRKKIAKDIRQYLKKMQELCESNGATLLLVSTPSAKNWNYKKHNSVQHWADKNGVDYLDLNLDKEIGIDWKKDTKDGGDHLNYTGAKKVTHAMGEYFKTHYDLNTDQ